MSLLDKFRRPDRLRKNDPKNKAEKQAEPLPDRVEPPPATTGAASKEGLPNRASEQDAA